MTTTAYDGVATLPDGVRARHVEGVNGLRMHILEAGFENAAARPCVLLLHGFPELAWSWRELLVPLAQAGWHVVAPDQRGYGQTTGWARGHDIDLVPFGMPGLVRDMLALVARLGRREVAVVGHDFGSPVAAWGGLIRPDVFRAVCMMSAPFGGAPAWGGAPESAAGPDLDAAFAALPRPRKHYQWYYTTRAADADMHGCPQGVHAFLRAYFHMKSADWPDNRPFPLAGWTAEALAQMPGYYVMDRGLDMAAQVAPHMPSPDAVAACRWLPEDVLRVYSAEFGRDGFQGGLNWYRGRVSPQRVADDALFAGRTIDVPACYIAGAADWCIHQAPGAFDAMQTRACTQWRGTYLIDGAGHWVQQEQPHAVLERLLPFLAVVGVRP